MKMESVEKESGTPFLPLCWKRLLIALQDSLVGSRNGGGPTVVTRHSFSGASGKTNSRHMVLRP